MECRPLGADLEMEWRTRKHQPTDSGVVLPAVSPPVFISEATLLSGRLQYSTSTRSAVVVAWMSGFPGTEAQRRSSSSHSSHFAGAKGSSGSGTIQGKT